MNALRDELLRAVGLAASGDWGAAHRIVQAHEGQPDADWIHAVIHRIEGDLGNSRYWYRQAGKPALPACGPEAELEAIRRHLDAG